MFNNTTSYKAAIYLRLSKEDGDKEESYSISNQRDLAMDFLSNNPDIALAEEMVDDGYSGSNFDRPNFQRMIEKITVGEINCVIVKDLSRFARDYIGSGYYLEKLFPSMGVRFISINDKIDYKIDDSSNTRLIMEIKNVMNDSYIRDISVKIRSQFEIKRKKGEYIGAFTVYGYEKSKEDKHKLVVDKNAAEIVKTIFNMRMQGISAVAIAHKLNLLSVPSPSEHKKLNGSNFNANLQRKYKAEWSAKAVLRILKNEIYTGTLIQGTRTTANYKVKKIIEKDRSEWSIIPNNHEAIISQLQFDTVQKLISRDTRTAPGNSEPYLFSGFIECADCHCPLIRKTAKYNGKTYVYYMCSTNKLGYGCTSHRVNANAVYLSVLSAINMYCENVSDISAKINDIPIDEIKAVRASRIDSAIKEKTEEICNLERTLSVVENRCKAKLESNDSCNEICDDIKTEIKRFQEEISKLMSDKAEVEKEIRDSLLWVEMLSQNGKIIGLNRKIVTNLVDKIYVYEDKRIEIRFSFEDKFKNLMNLYETNIAEVV